MYLTNYERETIITYNQEETTADVYTCDRSLMRKLDKLCGDNADIKLTAEDEYSKTYIFPKEWIKIKPPFKRTLTDEQRAEMSERAKANFKIKN